MDNLPVDQIERKLHEKIFLYNELLQCFHREKEALINMDMEFLWDVSKQKDELCERINCVQLELIARVDPESGKLLSRKIIELAPEEDRSRFKALFITINKLKAEIELIRKSNMDAADCSLKFLDEIISIISGGIRQEFVYNDRCRFGNQGGNLYISREV